MPRVRWFKLAAIGVGILIAFLIVGSVMHFIITAVTYLVIAALVAGGGAIAIKVARSGRQVCGKKDEREGGGPRPPEPCPRAVQRPAAASRRRARCAAAVPGPARRPRHRRRTGPAQAG